MQPSGCSYDYPTEDALSRLRDADVKVYRNDLQGTIICTSNGELASFTTEKIETVQTNSTVVTTPEQDEDTDVSDAGKYIGNNISKKNATYQSVRTFLLKRIGYIFLPKVNPSRKGMNRAVIVTPEE